MKNEDIAFAVVDAVIVFWNMALIKTEYRHNCMFDVIKIWTEWQNLMKNKGRTTDPGNKRANFIKRLDSLFDIGAPECIYIRRKRIRNSTNVANVNMTRFKYSVDLIKEIHVTDKDGTKIVSRETDWDDIIAERLVCEIRKFVTLLFCANSKEFSFRWIEEQLVQVHPGENDSERGGKCFKR